MDASEQSHYRPACSNRVEMHFIEIIMNKSLNNKLFLADGQTDRHTYMTKLIVS